MRAGLFAAIMVLGCGGEESESFDTNPGALDNGNKCLFTGAGAGICAGTLCVGNPQRSPFGVCSEVCGARGVCPHGGECVELRGLESSVCMVDCTEEDVCGEDLSCLPSNDVRPCSPGGCVPDLSRFWCQPPL